MAIPENELRHMAAIGMQHLLRLHERSVGWDLGTSREIAKASEVKPKRRISAKGRANIAAAMKKRWARWRKARMLV